MNIFLYSQINKGWNLIGINTNTSLSKIMEENEYIKKALYYKDDIWVSEAEIDSSDGIWIYAEKSFNYLKNEGEHKTNNYIPLNKGWNLKSIPMNKSISPYVLNENIYSYDSKGWASFNKNNKEITKLNSSNGFWVKSKEDINVSLKNIKLIKADFLNDKELEEYIENVVINNRQFIYDSPYSILEPENKTTYADTDSVTPIKIDATSTNLQEKDVDEIDIIKHNGKEIFFIQNNNIFLTSFDDILLNKKGEKKIIKFNDISLRPYGMYLYNNKLIVFSKNSNIQEYKERNKTYISMFDISNEGFLKIKEYEIDGDIFTSRISNNQLYIINSFYPNYKVEYKRKESDCNIIYNKEICNIVNYDDYKIIAKTILPKIKNKEEEHNIVKYNNFYINPIKTESLNIMSVLSIDLITNNFKDSSSIDGNINNFYASSRKVYLVSSNDLYTNYYDYERGSKIYSFSIENKILFSGGVDIQGRVNNQFSLSEYNDTLRVVTTQGSSWKDDTNNTLFLIKENKVISSIDNLGKKGETVKAVRFFGDKAFVVTFKQTDPLYILDLSNHYNPIKVSELEITGFSTYFHYIDKDHLLTIGKDADEEGITTSLQLQLFNISNLSSPFLQSKLKIGNKSSYSSAIYNSKSFVYHSKSKLLSIDYSNFYENDFIGFKIFKIDDEISLIQDIEKDKGSQNYYYDNTSILFINNNKNYMGYIDNESIKVNKIGE